MSPPVLMSTTLATLATPISPDQIVYGRPLGLPLNATIVFTWILIATMGLGAALVTRRLRTGPTIPRWQNLLEVVVGEMQRQMREIGGRDPARELPFVGTIFLFILVSNILMVVPGWQPPTGSLSTTTALALLVFLAVPAFGIARRGPAAYLRRYLRPTPLMLPFNVIAELSRTLALAVRLFGNVMSGTRVVAILLALVPLVLPVLMQLLGLLTGVVQAYIFAVLAMVAIASASRPEDEEPGAAGAGPASAAAAAAAAVPE